MSSCRVDDLEPGNCKGSYNFTLYREYHATTGGIYKSEIKS